MTNEEYAQTSELIARDMLDHINTSMQLFYTTYGHEKTNTCFATAMAIAVGNMLSAYSTSLNCDRVERKEMFKHFDHVMKESAKKHRHWKMKETH